MDKSYLPNPDIVKQQYLISAKPRNSLDNNADINYNFSRSRTVERERERERKGGTYKTVICIDSIIGTLIY